MFAINFRELIPQDLYTAAVLDSILKKNNILGYKGGIE